MKLQKGEKGEVDVGGFSVPEAGTSICQIMEGIDTFHKEETGVVNMMIPLKIDSVIEGPEDNVGQKPSDWICLKSREGSTPAGAERKLSAYLVNTDLMDKFVKRFGEDLDPLSDEFLGKLKLALTDKFIGIKHSRRKDNNGKDQFNVETIFPAGAKKAEAPKAEASGPADEDW